MSEFKRIRKAMDRAAMIALLEEIREPSLTMILVGEKNEDSATRVWQCMIDEKIDEIRRNM